jgi:hypothetical protein
MKPSSSLTIVIVAAGCLIAGASPSSAQGPYYAVPAWNQKLPVSTRFVPVLFAQFCSPVCEQIATAVLDRETGLVWERVPSSSESDFREAQIACALKVRANRGGWRLPGVDELTSLRDHTTTSGVALPPGHPFLNIVTGASYWTSTEVDPDEALLVHFNAGVLSFIGSAPIHNFDHAVVWCVRGGGR